MLDKLNAQDPTGGLAGLQQQVYDLQDAAKGAADALATQTAATNAIASASASLQSQIDALVTASETVDQQRADTLAKLNAQDPTGGLAQLQQQVYDLSDAAATAAAAVKAQTDATSAIASAAASLQSQIDQLTTASESLGQQRQDLIDKANVQDPSGGLAQLQQQVFDLQDAAAGAANTVKAAADAVVVYNDRLSLLAQITALTGDAVGAAAVQEAQRQTIIDKLNAQDTTGGLVELQQELWKLQDTAKEVADSIKQTNSVLGYEQALNKHSGGSDITNNQLALDAALDNMSRVVPGFNSLDDALNLTADGLATLTPDQIGYVQAVVNASTGLNDATAALVKFNQQLVQTYEQATARFRPADTAESLGSALAGATADMFAQTGLSSLDDALSITNDQLLAMTDSARQSVLEFLSAQGALDDFNTALQKTRDDADKAAAATAAETASKESDLQIRLMQAQGDAAGALAKQRERERAAADASLQPILDEIYAQEDLNAANQATADAAKAAADATAKFISDLNAIDNAALSYRQARIKYGGGNEVDQAGLAFDNALNLMVRNVPGVQSLADALSLTDEQLLSLTPDQLNYVTAVITGASNLDAALKAVGDAAQKAADDAAKAAEDLRKSMQAIWDTASGDVLSEALAANATPWEKLITEGNSLDTLAAYFDGTADATTNLANATQSYRRDLVQMVSTIEQLKGSVQALFDANIRDFTLDGLDKQGQYKYLQSEVDKSVEDLRSATDPQRINALAQLIASDQKQAYGLLDPTQKTDAVRQEFIAGAQAANDLIQERLKAAEDAAIARNDKLVDDLRDALKDAGLTFKEAADGMQKAADTPKEVDVHIAVDVNDDRTTASAVGTY